MTGALKVGGPDTPTLTLEAGVVVRFERGASLTIGAGAGHPGELRVEGTGDAPVLLTAHSDAPQPGHWEGLSLSAGSTHASRLSHVTIEYADGSAFRNVCDTGGLTLGDVFTPVLHPLAVLDHVTVQKTRLCGVVLHGAPGPGSTRLVSRDNGQTPLSVDLSLVESIPPDSLLQGNARDAVEVQKTTLERAQSWRRLDVPYLLAEQVLTVQGPGTVLTLAPGVDIQVKPQAIVFVTQGASLHAEGSATEPIRFMPDMATPHKGHWGGLWLLDSPGSRLDHVVLTHGGRATGSNLLVVPGEDRREGPLVTHSTFEGSAGCGIRTSRSAPELAAPLDYTLTGYGNTFSDNDGGAQCNHTVRKQEP
ncbi:MAG: hypothetical protein ABW123_28590 [Cystobacter sp.]